MAEEGVGQMITAETTAVLVKYWSTIDWLATALLLNSSTTGDIKLWPIIEYFYSNPRRLSVPARSTYFKLPRKHVNDVTTPSLKALVPDES